jgi:type IV secretory pathway VirB10-like protein
VASRCQNALAWYGSKAVLHRALTPAESDVLKRRLATVRKTLMPASGQLEMARIERAVSAALMGYSRPEPATVRNYVRLLNDLPAWAVEAACDDVRRGAATGFNPHYQPAAPAIHQLADEKLVKARAERDRMTLLLTAPVEDATSPMTEEGAQRVQAILKSFHEQVGKDDRIEGEQRKARQAKADMERANREEHSRRMEYLLQGLEPITLANGKTMTLSLARAKMT